MLKNNKSLKIRFLGGLGEIGKNMTALEYGKDIIVIDAGVAFPTEEMPGIDLVIPDTTYLVQNKDRVRGIVITHGHEDHIGSLPFLLKDVNAPVFGTKLALTLAESKMHENHVTNYSFNCIKPSSTIKLGCFTVEFIHVNHSIPGAVALAITTPVGVVFHSGDFKVDLTPINGDIIDITRISEIGKKGVLLLMCESTNVERPGYTMSESVVGETLDRLFAENEKRRIIIATFASNVYRLQQILDLAAKYKRKVAFSGRSMEKVTEAAAKIGELVIPPNTIVELGRNKNIPDKDLVIVSTGSQGEPMSALTRMAADDFKNVKIGSNDTIIISASPIPGNEKSIYSVINNLYRKGAEVVYETLEKIHVSGHACQEELKILHTLVNPKFFIPVHGEYRHLKKHVTLARSLGMRESNMLIAEIGSTVELTGKSMKFGESFQAGSRLVDGLNIEDSGNMVRDRKHLAEDGVIFVVCCISADSAELLQEPIIECKGVTLSDEQKDEMKRMVTKTVKGMDVKSMGDKGELRGAIRRAFKNYVFKRTKGTPMVLPVITEI
ncbi:MAG: ribonuclease J [Clostridia bacterium]|nr:ribonuclease J [Clostridia bacterium]MBQ9482043.1 ribonuclease J [Clostridia bacterium]